MCTSFYVLLNGTIITNAKQQLCIVFAVLSLMCPGNETGPAGPARSCPLFGQQASAICGTCSVTIIITQFTDHVSVLSEYPIATVTSSDGQR